MSVIFIEIKYKWARVSFTKSIHVVELIVIYDSTNNFTKLQKNWKPSFNELVLFLYNILELEIRTVPAVTDIILIEKKQKSENKVARSRMSTIFYIGTQLKC